MKLRALRNHRIRILEGRICKSPANPIEINSQNHLFQSRKTPEGGGNNGPRPVRGPTPVCLSGNSVLRQKIVSNRVQAVCFQRLLSFHTRKLPKNRHFLPLFSTPKNDLFFDPLEVGTSPLFGLILDPCFRPPFYPYFTPVSERAGDVCLWSGEGEFCTISTTLVLSPIKFTHRGFIYPISFSEFLFCTNR